MKSLYKSQKKSNQPNPNAIIELTNIQKTYLLGVEGVAALRGVSLEVEKGEFVIIYGTSGGGKSTLLNVIGSIDKPTKGQMQLFKTPIRSKTGDDVLAGLRLKKMGFIFQTFNLLSSMTALENVELPMILLGKLGRRARRKRAKELLTMVGMQDRLGHVPAQLSGGEQQRVTIARAIANKPDILLLDEPTGSIGQKNTPIVMDLLHKLNVEEKITMVMVTHDPNLKRAADRVIWMRDGKIYKIEKVPEKDREGFWAENEAELPKEHVDQMSDKPKKTKRSRTKIRHPHSYLQLQGSLDESTQYAHDLLSELQPRNVVMADSPSNTVTQTMSPNASINSDPIMTPRKEPGDDVLIEIHDD